MNILTCVNICFDLGKKADHVGFFSKIQITIGPKVYDCKPHRFI